MPKMNTLRDLLLEEVKDLYDAENQIVKALPKMIKASSSNELQKAFKEHLEKTEGHVQRLERIFEKMGERPKAKKCDGMRGIIEEAEDKLSGDAEDPVKDAGIIAALQKVEHYEMAAYGSARTWASHLGERGIAQLLEQTLDEEKEADKKLSDIAEQEVNVAAAQGEGAEGAQRVEGEEETSEVAGLASTRARTRRGRKSSGPSQRP